MTTRVGAQGDGRLDRRIQAYAAVRIPVAGRPGIGDVHRWEDGRDGRGREHVRAGEFHGEVIDTAAVVAFGNWASRVLLQEHRRLVGGERRRDHCDRRDPALLYVAMQVVPVLPTGNRPAKRIGVEQAGHLYARQVQQLAQVADGITQRAAGEWSHDVAPPHRTPHAQRLLGRLVGVEVAQGGKEQHVERTGAGTDEDGWTLAMAGKGWNQDGERTRLVGAARTSACHHKPDRLLCHSSIQIDDVFGIAQRTSPVPARSYMVAVERATQQAAAPAGSRTGWTRPPFWLKMQRPDRIPRPPGVERCSRRLGTRC